MLHLIACTCLPFAEMDVTGDAGAEDLALVRGTLDQFAAWTAVDGVCVPEIEADPDIPEPFGLPDAYESGGVYRGEHQPIWVDVDAGESAVDNTRHELCHALDMQLGLSTAHETLIPDVADPDLYPGTQAEKEDFAVLCQEWPTDTTFTSAVVDACGGEPVDSVAQFVLDEIYPGYPRLDLDPEPVSLQVDELTWAPADVGGLLDDIRELDGAMAALVVSGPDADARRTLSLRTFSSDLQTVLRDEALITGPNSLRGSFVASDAGLYIEARNTDGGDLLMRVDAESWAVEPLPIGDVSGLSRPIISGDRIISNDLATGQLGAWTFDGAVVELDPPALLFDQVFWPDVLWPVDGGFGFYAYEGAGSWVDGAWSLAAGPTVTHDRQALDDGRVLVHAVSMGPRMMIEDDGVWRFAGDPCDPDAKEAWAYGDLAVVGGRIFRTGWAGTPTEDADGDGRVEEPLYSLVVGR